MANQSFNVNVQGDAELLRAMAALGPSVTQVVAAALYRSGEEIVMRSKNEFVPIDTGTLSSTIHTEEAKVEGNEVTVRLVAGGPACAYAVYVHEIDKEYRNGRQWKYLETPAKEAVNDIENELRQSIADALR